MVEVCFPDESHRRSSSVWPEPQRRPTGLVVVSEGKWGRWASRQRAPDGTSTGRTDGIGEKTEKRRKKGNKNVLWVRRYAPPGQNGRESPWREVVAPQFSDVSSRKQSQRSSNKTGMVTHAVLWMLDGHYPGLSLRVEFRTPEPTQLVSKAKPVSTYKRVARSSYKNQSRSTAGWRCFFSMLTLVASMFVCLRAMCQQGL